MPIFDNASLPESVLKLIDLALMEDLGSTGDITSATCVPEDLNGLGVIKAKQDLVLAGSDAAAVVFHKVDPDLRCDFLKLSGEHVKKDEIVAKVSGKVRSLLAGERTALNLLCRLSGVATLTSKFVAAAGRGVQISDTRKTTPGMRYLEKMAVLAGGGLNHRMGLYDAVLIKDNHVDAAGGVFAAIEKIKISRPDIEIEVEVRDLAELDEAVAAGAHWALCDNFSLEDLQEAVRRRGKNIYLEASGGVDLRNVSAIAASGVHRISIGGLTHSAPAVDLNMKVVLT
jgi:nicotinate-nucleotide pyrophosphorylase (carboxylating)